MAGSRIWQFLRRLGIGGEEKQIDATSQLLRLGRDEYKYVEGERCITLQIEMLIGEPKRAIYSSTIRRWHPPHENEEITDEDRHRIATKIANFFASRSISTIVK